MFWCWHNLFLKDDWSFWIVDYAGDKCISIPGDLVLLFLIAARGAIPGTKPGDMRNADKKET